MAHAYFICEYKAQLCYVENSNSGSVRAVDVERPFLPSHLYRSPQIPDL